MADKHIPITKEKLLDSVQRIIVDKNQETPFTNNRPGKMWYSSFMKRHPTIAERKPQNLCTARDNVTQDDILKWFSEVECDLKERGLIEILKNPARIFNTDESAFFLNPKPGRVLAKKGDKNVYTSSEDDRENLTVLVTGNAAGELAPTLVVFNYARIPSSISETFPSDWAIGRSESGWMCSDNLSCFTHGCSTGWVSGVLGNEALTGGAWLAALPCLVALPAAPFFAVLADARGRKAGAFSICVSFIISWSLAAWSGPRGVWAARVAAGAGGAGALALAPLYCAEIAPRTRGLAAMPALACSSGILFAYAAGGILSAHALSLSMAVPPAILLVSLFWLPETPSFLISVGKIQDAAKIICWFDGSDFREDLTDVIEQQEVKIRTSACYGRREPIRRQDSDTFQPMLKRSSGLDSNSDKKHEQSACRELFRHRRTRRALLSCVVVGSAAAGSGVGAVNSFAAAVLRHSTHGVPRLNLTAYNFTMYNGTAPRPLFESSEAGSILCGTALVLGAAVATVSVDKVGRKMLLLWSCSGITCCLAILGVYCDPSLRLHSWYSHRLWPYRRTNNLKDKGLQLNENLTEINLNAEWKNYTSDVTKSWRKVNFENESIADWKVQNLTDKPQNMEVEENLWAPVILLSIVLFLYNIGLGSVPYVLISELFTMNVRSLASGLLISWMWLSNFFLLRYYGTLAISVGLHGTYYICASITLLGSLYIFFIIPETKGRSQEQIDEALDGPLLVIGRRKKDRNQR